MGAVRSEWDVAYEEKLRHSERAVKEYALTEHASKIESAMGTANWLRLTAQLGRYTTGPKEVYGRSPAMTVLPEIKMVNEMSQTVLNAGQKALDPPLLLQEDGALTRDRDFIKRYLSEDHEAAVKMKTLHAAAHRPALEQR